MQYQIEQRNNNFTVGRIKGLMPTPHIHTHLELVYLSEGASIAYADNRNFLLEAGDLFISFPNQIHYYHDQKPVKGYLIIFSPDLCADFEKIFKKQVPVHSVLKSSQIPSDMEQQMEKILELSNSDMPLKQTAIKGYFAAILAMILPELSLTESAANQDTVKTLLSYCIENYTEPLSLNMVSEQLHLSKYYICHVFKERMGTGFAGFINKLRIANACSLLNQGSTVTDAAYTSGFSSIRTFNRVFSKSMNMSPREYIAGRSVSAKE